MLNIVAKIVIRVTLDGCQGGLQIAGRMVTNLRYAEDVILLATSEAELPELVDRLDRVSREYSLLTNVDKTKVVSCMNELLEQVDTFPCIESLITEFRTRLNRGYRRSGHHCRKYGKVTPYRFQRRYDL